MKVNYFGFRYLDNPRYDAVTAHNVIEVSQFSSVFAGSNPPELLMAVPYSDLVTKLKEHFSLDSGPGPSALQQYRNYLSTLNGYLAFCGKTLESNVGIELTSQFDTRLRAYLDGVKLASRTLRDRALQLKTIQRLYRQVLTPQNSSAGTLSDFAAALRQYVADSGIAPKTLAKQSGVDPTTLNRWLKGATPRDDTLPALRRLEVRLGLERDTLVRCIRKPVPENAVSRTVPSHRLRMAKRRQDSLVVPESALSEPFLKEWRALFDYKVSNFPTLERQPRGRWRLIPTTMSRSLSELAKRGSMICPTADMTISSMRSFLGVICNLPPESGGIPWNAAPSQTLALCAHPRVLECYLQWMSDQSEGIRHNGQKVFARTIANWLRPQTGYLWQQATVFRERLPEELRPESDEAWRKMCGNSHKFLRDYIRSATGISRSPEEPISDLLALPSPLKPLLEAIERIDADAAAAPPGSITEARHKRNALVLALLLSNPMRVRTLASLTWLPNGHGTVRGTPSQGWRIMLQPLHLKNGNSQQSRAYNVKVADWVKPRLDEYIEEYRDTLLAGKSNPYLLVGDRNGGIWEGLTHAVLNLTRRYIPGSPGFGPHAIRHLVATDWLRNNPGDFLTVAELLNDTLTTVLANYAHLRRDDSFARYEEHIARLR